MVKIKSTISKIPPTPTPSSTAGIGTVSPRGNSLSQHSDSFELQTPTAGATNHPPYPAVSLETRKELNVNLFNKIERFQVPDIFSLMEEKKVDIQSLVADIHSLVQQGADIHSKSENHETALSIARELQNPDLIKVITQEIELNEQFHRVAQSGTKEEIQAFPLKWLINSLDENGSTALINAVNSKDRLQINTLLDFGAEINAQGKNGMTALFVAAGQGDRANSRLLLNRGADVIFPTTIQGFKSAVEYAGFKGHEAVTQLILQEDMIIPKLNNASQTLEWITGTLKEALTFYDDRSDLPGAASIEKMAKTLHAMSTNSPDDGISHGVRSEMAEFFPSLLHWLVDQRARRNMLDNFPLKPKG